MWRLLFVGRLAAHESQRYFLLIIEGDQVGRETGGYATQALTQAKSCGGIAGGHADGLEKRCQALA